ncbi:hypothetical protein [Paenirhodobacter sp. CAU 1674]|uniref:hypothetical protein n=1 Tax=Paenirhodobacter sp. CAU 1674 TaxID=3032596 RepID=UPI0023DC9764|nr:hypothetical protein [Paenirhodobacter sp. CAU 1674]MDF2140987.1 hypothetical protein [Paenirhodobacter sp. CAU 1674]
MRRLFICLAMTLALGACGAEQTWAPDAEVQRAAYVSGEPPSVTLYTVISTSSGAGGHSSVMIDGTQRVMFDPAGSWYHPWVPERNDVHYGITEKMRKFYIDYHARATWDVLEQKVPVTLEQAEMLRARAEGYGAVSKMMCARSTSSIFRGVPGFESIPQTFSPLRLSAAFAKLPGVQSKLNHDGDPDNNSGVLMIQQEEVRYQPVNSVK